MLIRFIYKFINIGVFISLTPRSAEDKIKTALRNNNGNEIIIKYKDAVARIALSPFSHAGKYGAIIIVRYYNNQIFAFSKSGFHFYKTEFKECLTIGIPVVLERGVICLGHVTFASLIAKFPLIKNIYY